MTIFLEGDDLMENDLKGGRGRPPDFNEGILLFGVEVAIGLFSLTVVAASLSWQELSLPFEV